MTEFRRKQERIQELLKQHRIQALLLQRNSSFAWATCGAAAYVNTATTFGTVSLLITPTGKYLITNNIEATRLMQEEKLTYQGWEFKIVPWYEKDQAIEQLTSKLKLGADGFYPRAKDLSVEIAHLRSNLTPEENVRFRVLGRFCAGAIDAAVRSIQPGWTEHQIAAKLAEQTLARGATPIVYLIATDERIFAYRHPLPTYKPLERYAMLVLCARRWGLVCSVTRLVYFGHLPDDLRQKAEAVARVDAAMIAATRPGVSLGYIFEQCKIAYKECGYPDEWQLHHQGGPAAYEPREYLATPYSTEIVQEGQAYAWNPSITGTKSEDSIQVGPSDTEIVTAITGWPTLPIVMNNQTILRPAILEIE
jgi:Xaa-Pro aminopeptidase